MFYIYNFLSHILFAFFPMAAVGRIESEDGSHVLVNHPNATELVIQYPPAELKQVRGVRVFNLDCLFHAVVSKRIFNRFWL